MAGRDANWTDMPSDSNPGERSPSFSRPRGWQATLARLVLGFLGLVLAGVVSVAILAGVALAVAYPNLPDISDLSDYRPKLPLRIYSADHVLIGEFGEERRNLTT